MEVLLLIPALLQALAVAALVLIARADWVASGAVLLVLGAAAWLSGRGAPAWMTWTTAWLGLAVAGLAVPVGRGPVADLTVAALAVPAAFYAREIVVGGSQRGWGRPFAYAAAWLSGLVVGYLALPLLLPQVRVALEGETADFVRAVLVTAFAVGTGLPLLVSARREDLAPAAVSPAVRP